MADDDFLSDLAQIQNFNRLGGNAYIPVNLSRDRGNILTDRNQIILDRSALNPFDFAKKYGADIAREMDQLDLSAGQTAQMMDDDRTPGDIAYDAANNIALGLNNAIGGVGVFGASLISPETGVAAAELLNGYNEWNRSKSTVDTQNAAQLDAARAALDKQDSLAQFEEERKTVGDFEAGLNMFGRDALNSATRLLEDPRTIENLVEQGGGSLLAAGPVAKGLGVIGQAVARTAGMEVAAVSTQSMVPAAIGAMEGGGAFASAMEEVLNTSFEDLAKNSPEFNQMVANGMAPEDARRRLAGKAGVIAESIQAPIAAATGTLVSKFEAAPLAAKPLTEMLGNVARETIEEGIQSATGQISQNIGIKATANENQDILDDVAATTVQGAIAGSLSAGAISAPGTVLSETANALKAGGTKLLNSLTERGDRVQAEIDAASPISDVDLEAGSASAAQLSTNVAEAVSTLANSAGADKPSVDSYNERLVNASKITSESLNTLPEHLRASMPQTDNLFVNLAMVGRIAADETASKADRTSAALFLLNKVTENQKLFTEDLPAYLRDAPKDTPEYQEFSNYNLILNSMVQSPQIAEALRWANEEASVDEPLTAANINTPAGKQTVDNTIGLATHAPQNVTNEAVASVLYHAERGDISITKIQKGILEAAKYLLEAGRVFDSAVGNEIKDKPSGFISEPTETVSSQIEVDGGTRPYQYSMEQHVRRINEAMAAGNTEAAKERLADLAFFARHMQNKVAALIKSIEKGDGSKFAYQTLGANHVWVPEERWNSVFYKPGSENSARLAKRIHAEASAIAALSNGLANTYPEYGFKQIVIPALPPLAQPKAKETRDLNEVIEPTVTAQESESQTGTVDSAPNSDSQNSLEPEPVQSEPTEQVTEEPAPEPSVEAVEPSQPVDEETPIETQEAPVEPSKAKTEDAPQEAAVPVFAEKFKGLIGKANRFLKAFDFGKTLTSRLSVLEYPIQAISTAVSAGESGILEFTNGKVRYSLNGEQANALEFFLQGSEAMAEIMENNLFKFLNRPLKKGEAKTIADALREGNEDPLQWRIGRALNLVEDIDGDYHYNQTLLGAAVLAGMDWMLNYIEPLSQSDVSEISRETGIPDSFIDNDFVKRFNHGSTVARAKRDLARKIGEFWGLRGKSTTDQAVIQGTLEAMAAEVLSAFKEVGFIGVETTKYNFDNNGVKIPYTIKRITTDTVDDQPVRRKVDQEMFRSLRGAKNIIADMALVDPERVIHIGTPPSTVAEFQLRNPFAPNTDGAKEVIELVQNQPYFVNSTFALFISEIGEDDYLELMGGLKYTDATINAEHERSVEGVNRTLTVSYNNVMDHVQEVYNRAKAEGIKFEDMPSYFAANFSRVGRIQMQGLNNPQSDKLAREILMPTKEIVDATDSEMLAKIWMTVGQGLGLKTEYLPRAEVMKRSIQDTQLISGKFTKTVELIEEWLQGGGRPIAKAVAKELRRASEGKNTNHMLQSLMTVARLNIAQREGTLKEFEAWGYLEADGKTNGPINALALLTTGAFTPDYLQKVAKGGYFIGAIDKSLNDHWIKDNKDLYQSAADRLQEIQKEFVGLLDGAQKELYEDFEKILTELDVNVQFDGQNIIVNRNATKNPLTISIYGSGVDGIAGKVAAELADAVYERVTEVMRGKGAAFSNRFHEAFENVLTKTTNEIGEVTTRKTGHGNRTIGRDYKLSAKDRAYLKRNVRKFYVDNMSRAINDEIMHFVKPATTAIQQATNAQSIVLSTLFQVKIIEKINEKRLAGTWKPGDFLSQNELKAIQNSLSAFAPVLDIGDQSYYLSGSETTDFAVDKDGRALKIDGERVSPPEEFGSDFNEEFDSKAYTFAPGLLGVGGVPTVVIGSGDGQMIINGLRLGAKGLPVFDGFNMPTSKIDEYGRIMNEAVFQSWQNNPIHEIAKSFSSFMAAGPVQEILKSDLFRDYFIENMSKNFLGMGTKEMLDMGGIEFFLGEVQKDLNSLSASATARQLTIEQFAVSVDQMASTEKAYSRQGAVTSNQTARLSDQELANLMNQFYNRLLGNVELGTKGIPAGDVLDLNTNEYSINLPNQEKFSAADDGVRVVEASNLDALMESISKKISKTHKEMLLNTSKALKGSGYRVVFGTPDELRNWENKTFPNNVENVPYMGKIDTQNRVIYISNNEPETIVHELIHAATIDKTVAFYKNKSSLNTVDQGALTRIEGLMNEWLAVSFEDVSDEFASANQTAVLSIRERLAKGQKAAALNEFMAYSLSNQAIANVQSKVKVKNPAWKVIGDALISIWRMIWGTKFAPNSGDTIFSNLRFNTRVLLATPTRGELLRDALNGVVLYQSPSYGSNDRISALTAKFVGRINDFIQKGDALYRTNRQQSYDDAIVDAINSSDLFIANGFSMNMQQQFLFKTIHAAMAVAVKFNTNALSSIQDIYAHVMENLKVEDFMVDREANDPNDRYQAQRKFDVLNGRYGIQKDKAGRSNLMSSFLALAMVDEQFRTVIGAMKPPAKFKSEETGLDGIVENVLMGTADALNDLMAGKRSSNLLSALDGLISSMNDVTADQQTFIEQQTNRGVDAIDNYIADNIQKLSKKALDATQGKPKTAGTRLVRAVATALNADASKEWVEGVISTINKASGFNTMREFVAEIVGRTDSNASIFDMISRVRSSIQQVRQQYREHLPEELGKKFTRELTDNEWSLLFKGLAKTDLSALFDHVGLRRTLTLLTSQVERTRRIGELEAELANINVDQAIVQRRKAMDLAEYMINGKTSVNHLRNAYAVTHMLGESTAVPLDTLNHVVPIVDQLTTLYAVDLLPRNQQKDLADLIDEQQEGVNNTLAFLIGERRTELEKTVGRAKINGYKGYIPSDNQLGTSLVVMNDQEYSRLVTMGYQRIGDYEGASYDTTRVRRGYYFSPVSGNSTYNQGVLQTVHSTASGVDPKTGYTIDITAGRITNPTEIAALQAVRPTARAGKENLLPIYNVNGEVIAFERGIDPEKLTHINRNTHLAQMMGAWIGRQYEERLATAFNMELVGKLSDIYRDGLTNNRGDEFVNIATSRDPIHQDTWDLVPNETRDIIRGYFGRDRQGNDQFFIRKDMINDAVGFRSVSVGDLWTGNTRLKPAVSDQLRRALMGVFGAKTFEYLVKAERIIQNVVTEAKVLIVVKSVVVPVSNMVSNVFQLMNRGVPLRSIIHGLGSKTAELNDFIKRRQKQLSLEADLRSAEAINDVVKVRRIENELRTIKDSYKRMSIYPLIKAGEFASISDGGVTQEDIALAEGKWGQFIEKLADKVPGALKTPVRYALLTRDTALFQGLTRAVQYGDFLGKAIMYDHLVNNKKNTTEEALAKISEEFVNYNRLAGRNRNYLESMGLIWFWNFKLRAMKTAIAMMRENPFRAFMMTNFGPSNLPLLGSIGSPITDNFVGVMADGKLGYSIGPGMGLNSPFINPWLNIVR